MKIRNGFVSNSSSSSFVLVGWSNVKIPSYWDEETDAEFYSEKDEENGIGYFPEEGLFGVVLKDVYEDEDYDIQEADLGKLMESFGTANILRFRFNLGEPKLIYGKRAS